MIGVVENQKSIPRPAYPACPSLRCLAGQFFFCFDSVTYIPLHRARRAMAAACCCPSRGTSYIFPPVYPFPTPGPACAVIVGVSPRSPSPQNRQKAQTKKKKKKNPTQPNQTVRAPPASSEADSNPPCPPPHPHPPPGRLGTRPESLGAPSVVGAAILHRAAPVLPIRIGLLVPACWSTRGAWVRRAVVGRM